MKLSILGCSGSEIPGRYPTAFLVNNDLLLDAGTVGAVLGADEQRQIHHVLVTHPHLDHVCGIPFLADALVLSEQPHKVTVYSVSQVLDALHNNLFNGIIWPDFTKVPSPISAPLKFHKLTPGVEVHFADYLVTAWPVHHTVPAVGYRIRNKDAILLYTGDTGPTDQLWQEAGEISALIVEVSFPNAMSDLALATGHLTPELLSRELLKLCCHPPLVLISHLKPEYEALICQELAELRIHGLKILHEGQTFKF